MFIKNTNSESEINGHELKPNYDNLELSLICNWEADSTCTHSTQDQQSQVYSGPWLLLHISRGREEKLFGK